MLGYIVTGIVLLAVSYALIRGMWKASKYLVIPTQILIFLALIFIVIKVFFTSDNVKSLKNEIDKSGIVESQEKAAKNMLKTTQSVVNQTAGQNKEQPAVAQTAAVPVNTSNPQTAPAKKTQSVKEQEKIAKPNPQEKKPIDPIDLM